MASNSIDLDSTELCLVDCGISSLQDVPFRSHFVSVNLRSNYITRIERLGQLRLLKHLDLSANQISRIEGLDWLISMRTLNLSCNLLRSLDGLSSLRNLEKLNVSYNQLVDISGVKALSGPGSCLSHLDLHGNKLSSVAHISQCLCRHGSLKHLVLSMEGSSNPVCHIAGYESELFSNLPQLQYIDGKDRYGNRHDVIDSTAAPGLEDFLDYLLSNGSGAESNSLHVTQESTTVTGGDLITPKIDEAMERFRRRQQQPGPSSTDTSVIQSVTDTEQLSPAASTRIKSRIRGSGEGRRPVDEDSRLVLLEQQIADLINKTKGEMRSDQSNICTGGESSDTTHAAPRVIRYQAERDDDGGVVDSDTDPGAQRDVARRQKKSRLPSYRKSTASSRARKDYKNRPSSTDESGEVRPRSQSPFRSASGTGAGVGPTARAESDTKIRNDIQSSYSDLMKEVETERERRWKAEAAAKKLVDHIKSLSSKAKEDGDMKELALDATSRLKQTVMNEREVKLRLHEDNEKLKEQLQDAVEHLSKSRSIQEQQAKTLREMEDIANKDEREKMKHQTHEHKKLQEALMRAAALSREVDLMKSTTDAQKTQIQSLQSLLASREQEHRDEMKTRYGLGSVEMQSAIQEQVKLTEKEHKQHMKQQQEKIEELSKQYSSLEDEFRQALQIESSRFLQLKSAFESVSGDNASNKSALLVAHDKDQKSAEMIADLTALVKEQKGRIAELSKSKQEQTSQYRERVNVLEAHVEEARKRMVQLEILKQDNVKLKSQVHGQESVMEGLRAERRLWEQELVQQGASLAQDRGSLDAKLEAQKSEISMLKKQLEREADGLKIKTKMLEDQTETIRKFKEAVEERDGQIKKCRQDNLKLQQSLEEQLSEERANNQDNQEMLERLRERKQDLKQQLSEIQSELDESKRAHSVLNGRWKEKSHLIGQLEQQVREMKESWEKKEVKLSHERDKALDAANLAIERLKGADDAFRNQIEDKVQSYKEIMARVERDKQLEIDQAYMRVAEVEEEMREMLTENQSSKKAMEDKMKRLTQAMTDLQTDLYQ